MIGNRCPSRAWPAAALAMGLVLLAATESGAYNRPAAYTYGYDWYNKVNPANWYWGGDPSLHEDANFVSQALIAGGLLGDAYALSEWGLSDNTIPNRAGLYQYLTEHEHADGTFLPTGAPGNLSPGDVVFFGPDAGDLQLTGILVGYDVYGEPLIAYHNPGSDGPVGGLKTLAELQGPFGGALFCHFPRPEDTPDDQRFFAVGNTVGIGNGYYGDNVLAAQVIRPGRSYLGYIVNNSNHKNQDLVIGTDTSAPGYTGCTYLIAAYCADPQKGVPAEGEVMSQPWTGDNPADYAYWVRKAMEYAVPAGYSAWDIHDAVWYITVGGGEANGITQAIGFPDNILPKGELKNGTFETGAPLPDSWTGSRLTPRDVRVTGVAHTGASSFRMKGGARAKSLTQTVTFAGEAGDTLTLTGWSKARGTLSSGGAYRMKVTVHYDGRAPRGYRKGFPKRTHGWLSRKLVIVTDAPYSRVDVSLDYSRQAGTAWFDDVQLQWEQGYAGEKALSPR